MDGVMRAKMRKPILGPIHGTRFFDEGDPSLHNQMVPCPIPGCERMMRKEAKTCKYHSHLRQRRQHWARKQVAQHLEGQALFLAGDISQMVEAFVKVAGKPDLERWRSEQRERMDRR